jgi:hypothetical protein
MGSASGAGVASVERLASSAPSRGEVASGAGSASPWVLESSVSTSPSRAGAASAVRPPSGASPTAPWHALAPSTPAHSHTAIVRPRIGAR